MAALRCTTLPFDLCWSLPKLW